MPRHFYVICIAVLLQMTIAGHSLPAAVNELTPAEKAAGWKLLFDGETLTGWKTTGEPGGWTVEDDTIVCLGKKQGYLTTVERFGNFALSLEFKITQGANSGVFLRWSDLNNLEQRGMEMQILDSTGVEKPGKGHCGAMYEYRAPRLNACKPVGEWNSVVIICKDNLVWVDMNGRRIIYMNLDRWTTPGLNPDGSSNKFRTALRDAPREGHIAFQDYGRRVWFRNIKIRPL